MAAAEAMLGEKHPDLSTSPTDNNTYILGKVYSHNIVIACLPSGGYGTTPAATVVTQMQSTFKSIRADIRLGDVVVSEPTRELGGVIQYDHGKTISGGRFEHTGILNKPLSLLLTAVSRLKAAHKLTPSRIPALLSEMLDRHPSMRKSFTYRGEDQDLLFDSEYDHDDPERNCHDCDTRRLVTRPARVGHDPVIHYGLIASGNQVMKHGRTRDQLARELGILCFEMEAAGLMNDFQCLVIRGICDYSDSHKNKQWQEYAAAAAAAYAKELLSVVHTTQVMDTPLACSNDVEGFGVPLEKVSSYDHGRVHRRLLHKRLVGTTQWFFDHPDFKAWFTEKSFSSLWCSGKIGSGKTIVAASVVEAAMHRNPQGRSPTVFFYCENEYRGTLNGSYILTSFIRQLSEFLLLTARPYPEDIIPKIDKFFGPERFQPDLTDLQDIFISLFHFVPDTIYVLDGIDALEQKDSKYLLALIQLLSKFSRPSSGSRFLLFSRDLFPGYINIATFIPGIRHILTYGNVMQDIEVYITTSMTDKSLYRRLTDNVTLLEEVKQIILTKSSGMFLWVYLQLEIIWDTCHTDAEIRSVLASLPKGLEETYNRCVDRITLQNCYASKVLKWVGFAISPLSVDELREAVSFDLEDTEWNPDKIPQKDVLVGCCANLVVIDRTDDCVRFVHSSVKQYLEKHLEMQDQSSYNLEYPTAEQGDLECGELCVTYLSFSDFSLQLEKHPTGKTAISIRQPALLAQQALFRNRHIGRIFPQLWPQNRYATVPFTTIRTSSTPDRAQYKFLNYAITNWALHTKRISDKSLAWDKFRVLATCFNETWNFHPWISGGRSNDSYLHALFGWAVREQHKSLLSIALADRSSSRRICDLPLTGESLPALHVASKLGSRNITEILLNICNVNTLDMHGYTALYHAASWGHIEICQLLLSTRKVKVDGPSNTLRTPLYLAAGHGHEAVVKLLLDRVLLAARNGHEAVVQLLLDRGADIEAKDCHGQAPLLLAVEYGNEAVVQLLLDRGADLEANDYHGQAPLFKSAGYGRQAVVQLLLDRGADIEAKDASGRTPLMWATENRHEAVVKLLHDKAKASRKTSHRY
ncbi:hypothetical protein BJX76DRAFT_352839 [Aspergillus varians]